MPVSFLIRKPYIQEQIKAYPTALSDCGTAWGSFYPPNQFENNSNYLLLGKRFTDDPTHLFIMFKNVKVEDQRM